MTLTPADKIVSIQTKTGPVLVPASGLTPGLKVVSIQTKTGSVLVPASTVSVGDKCLMVPGKRGKYIAIGRGGAVMPNPINLAVTMGTCTNQHVFAITYDSPGAGFHVHLEYSIVTYPLNIGDGTTITGTSCRVKTINVFHYFTAWVHDDATHTVQSTSYLRYLDVSPNFSFNMASEIARWDGANPCNYGWGLQSVPFGNYRYLDVTGWTHTGLDFTAVGTYTADLTYSSGNNIKMTFDNTNATYLYGSTFPNSPYIYTNTRITVGNIAARRISFGWFWTAFREGADPNSCAAYFLITAYKISDGTVVNYGRNYGFTGYVIDEDMYSHDFGEICNRITITVFYFPGVVTAGETLPAKSGPWSCKMSNIVCSQT